MKKALALALVFTLLLGYVPQISPRAFAEESTSTGITEEASYDPVSVFPESEENDEEEDLVIPPHDSNHALAPKELFPDTVKAESADALLDSIETTTFTASEAIDLQTVASEEVLRTKFGYSEAEIESAKQIYPSIDEFHSQLDAFAISSYAVSLPEATQQDILYLISHGYTNSQAYSAVVAAPLLGITLEELATEKAAELEEERQETERIHVLTPDDFDDEAPTIISEYKALATRMGVPYKVIETYMGQNIDTVSSLKARFDLLKNNVYSHSAESRSDLLVAPEAALTTTATNSSESFSYAPEKILSEPFSYEKLGEFNINLNKGSYDYVETDLSIPGKNGLDFNFVRRYQSENAEFSTPWLLLTEEDSGEVCLAAGYKPYLYRGEDENGDEILTEITSLERYTEISPINSDEELSFLKKVDPYYLTYYYADSFRRAASMKDSLREIWTLVYVDGDESDSEVIVWKPFITGIEPGFSDICVNGTMPYNYYVQEFGIGHGWSLGFSAIETYRADMNGGTKKRLITNTGEKYEIKFSSAGSHLVGYDRTDMILHNSGQGYSNARYTLEHKDGKKEYFDSNGRNIAIVDRYGNTITLSYTFASNGYVSAINIVDTMGNNIVFANENITYDPDNLESLTGSSLTEYNTIWTLKLNGELIKTYYILDETADEFPVSLIGVVDASEEPVLYSSGPYTHDFNGFVSTASTNDGMMWVNMLYEVEYPNGLIQYISTKKASERLGYAGYSEYYTVSKYEHRFPYNGRATTIQRKDYEFSDYSGLNKVCWNSVGNLSTYSTTVRNRPLKVTNGGVFLWSGLNVVHTFSQLTHNKKSETVYEWPLIQWNDIPSSGNTSFDELTADMDYTSKLARKTTYTYNDYDLPTKISISYYNPGSSSSSMSEVHQYTYDQKGNKLTETLPNNQVITWTYDSNYSIPLSKTYKQDADTTILEENTLTEDGKSIAQTTIKENGEICSKTDFTYDSAGRVTNEKSYSDATNYTETSYIYDSAAQPTEVILKGIKDADGNLLPGSAGYSAGEIATKNSYDNKGLVTSQTDGNGNVTTFEYDAKNRITKVVNPDLTTARYVYDDVNNRVTHTSENGTILRYEYDPSGNCLTGIYDVAGSRYVAKNEYDSGHRLVKERFYRQGDDEIRYYYYDAWGRVTETKTTNSSGTTTSRTTYDYSYTNSLSKTKQTVHGDSNAPSVITVSYSDNMGQVTKQGRVLNGSEKVDTYTYDYLGNVLTEKTAYAAAKGESFSSRYTYDHAGRVLTSEDAVGGTITNTYDWQGNLLSSADPSNNSTLYHYDALGRVVKQQTPFSEVNGSTVYAVSVNTYDPNGNVTLQKTTNNAPGSVESWSQTGYTYDNRNRLTQVKTYDNGTVESTTSYQYDGVGNILRMQNGSAVTTYTYDRFSNQLTKTDPLNQTESYTYDVSGSVLTKTDRNGNVTTYAYDDLGRVTSAATVTPSGTGNVTLTYAYTLTGQPRSESNGTGTTTYTYDALGRLLTQTDGANVRTYAYDIGDNRTSFVLTADGTQQMNTTYTYDGAERLTGVTNGSVTATYGYDTNGNRSYVEYNNGLRESYSYNKANLLTSLINKNSGGTVLSRYDYTYQLDGNQLSKTEANGKVTSNTYDDLGRLTRESTSTSGTVNQTYAYAYDSAGNRTSLTATGADA